MRAPVATDGVRTAAALNGQSRSADAMAQRAARYDASRCASSARRRPIRSTWTSTHFDPLLPFEAWSELGAKFGGYANATCWWLGDWLAFGQMKYGRRYKEAIAGTGLEYQTLRNYAVVARRFDACRRRPDLSFHHHAELCALDDEEQERWLELAAARHWSKTELRRRVAAAHRPIPPASLTQARVMVFVNLERARRWQEAAARFDCDIEHWLVRTLDQAALTVLGPPRDHASEATAPD
jgi:hypothetical protein